MIAWFRTWLTLAGALAAWTSLAGTASAQTTCARPNVPAATLRAALPEIPPLIGQQGISGTVQVLVSLDEFSRVAGAAIQSSPSAALNAAALSAARASTYQTEIRDCVPIATRYVFTVSFVNDGGVSAGAPAPRIAAVPQPSTSTTIVRSSVARTTDDSRPTVMITMQGIATRPPDVAYVGVGIITQDDVSTTAVAKNDAVFSALQTKLAALGADASKIKTTYYNIAYAPRPTTVLPPGAPVPTPAPAQPYYPGQPPRYGYIVTRQLQLTVDPAKVGAAIDASVASGATTVNNVQYMLADPSAAYNEALASALKGAKSQAAAVAQASGMHLGPVKQVQVQQMYPTPATGPLRGPINFSPTPGAIFAPPATVEVRASVTVTYFLKP